MNDLARRMVMDRQRRRMDSRRDSREYEPDGRRGRRNSDYAEKDYEMRRRDYRLSDDIGTEPEYPYETDGRRGVKGTGPYGIGGRLHSRARVRDYDDEDYEMDRVYNYEMDGHKAMKLHKKDMMKWKRQLENADGSHGEHFNMQQIMNIAQQMGLKWEGYDEKDLCMTANMLYSDFCEVLKSIIPPDKEVLAYVKMAHAWLEDPDAPVDGSEKLALYYYCIVSDED